MNTHTMVFEPKKRHAQDRYMLPERDLGGLSFEEHADHIRQIIFWLNEIGIATRNTRIHRYESYLDLLCSGTGDPEKVFHDPPDNPFNSPLDRILYVLREVHELMWIWHGLRNRTIPGLQEKLTLIVGGTDFAILDRNSASRDAQFELRIASYFARGDYALDLSTETDVIARSRHETFYVECKRVGSAKQLEKRTREAASQLRKRLPTSRMGRRFYGVAAVDVTKVAFSHNGLTRGITADHSRDVIRDGLEKAASQLDREKIWTGKMPILLWLQIHIPSLIENPPQVVTRFSTYGFTNPRLGSNGMRAARRIVSLWPSGLDDMATISPAHRPLRRSWTIPKGSTFAWDKAIDEWLDTGTLPDLEEDAEIAEITIDGDRQVFYFDEFSHATAQISATDHKKMGEAERTESGFKLVAMMLAARDRYVEGAPKAPASPPHPRPRYPATP